jgi:hypothetical protein
MSWNNGLARTSEYWARHTRSARRINPGSPSSPFPFVRPRNGGVPETLRRARIWARAGKR